jgi:hypothetical protein
MKVELLVNLKVASGKIISAGTIFSDEKEPIPEFIVKRIRRGMARIIAQTPAPSPVPVKEVKQSVPVPVQEEKPVEQEKEPQIRTEDKKMTMTKVPKPSKEQSKKKIVR